MYYNCCTEMKYSNLRENVGLNVCHLSRKTSFLRIWREANVSVTVIRCKNCSTLLRANEQLCYRDKKSVIFSAIHAGISSLFCLGL
jgi:hypothetical protein